MLEIQHVVSPLIGDSFVNKSNTESLVRKIDSSKIDFRE